MPTIRGDWALTPEGLYARTIASLKRHILDKKNTNKEANKLIFRSELLSCDTVKPVFEFETNLKSYESHLIEASDEGAADIKYYTGAFLLVLSDSCYCDGSIT